MKKTSQQEQTTSGSLKRRVRPERQAHQLKTLLEYLCAIGSGVKTFEVRKNDRDFHAGDILHLREWDQTRREWGPHSVTCFVTYVLRQFPGIEPGYCVMGIRLPANHQWPPGPNPKLSDGPQTP